MFRSHLETACRDICNLSATSFCERPLFNLIIFKLSPISIRILLYNIIIKYYIPKKNITQYHNAPFITGLQKEILTQEELTIRGEVVISYESFERLNDEISNPDQKHKNPRNLASASLRLLENRVASRRCMHFFAFENVTPTNESTVEETFANLVTYGFDVVAYKLCCCNVKDNIDLFEKEISQYQYPTDSLVLTYNKLSYRNSLGMTGKYPKHSIAFKWNDDEVETVLKNVGWSASKIGLLNPVAVFNPVEIEGTTVSRASLHNVRYVENLALAYGDTITVYKANKIIPQVNDNLTKNGKLIHVPATARYAENPQKE